MTERKTNTSIQQEKPMPFRKSENFELLLQTLDSVNDCISHEILYVNKSFCDTYLFEWEEVIGKNIRNIIAVEENILINPGGNKLSGNEGWKEKLVSKKKDGTEFIIELESSYVKDGKGKPVAILRVISDMTEQIKVEETAKLIQNKYKNLFTELKDAIYESTPDGKLTELNPSGYEFFGLESGRIKLG